MNKPTGKAKEIYRMVIFHYYAECPQCGKISGEEDTQSHFESMPITCYNCSLEFEGDFRRNEDGFINYYKPE